MSNREINEARVRQTGKDNIQKLEGKHFIIFGTRGNAMDSGKIISEPIPGLHMVRFMFGEMTLVDLKTVTWFKGGRDRTPGAWMLFQDYLTKDEVSERMKV